MNRPEYRYRREDFQELPVTLHHLDVYLSFFDDRVEGINRLEMTARQPLESLTLDAADLEILEVEWISLENGAGEPLSYDYLEDSDRLVVHLPRRIREGERLAVRTITKCFPSDTILEGIYKDVTPRGAPQQFMSQCQQWGFQRILPIFDDCRAKCTMTTTLEADARYTHLVSNGNASLEANPHGKPVPKPGDPGRQIITYRNPVPMAPYLFIACAGTWEVLEDEVAYDSGRRVRLQYLVPPGRKEGARIPLEILKKAVLWVARTQDYEYTGEAYRTICMTRSNFGGMENVGNTTIVTDAALVDEHTLDSSLLYAHAVIVHEFEHNQCGSETTMETPFDVWLNEAYTVDVERRFLAHMFDPAFVRLHQVDSIRHPLLGPLAIEDGGHLGRIVRDGFNDPDELIDSVTYVKAAEVIRMLRLTLGEETFRRGKALYFSRYRHGNANTDQFFACFEEISGRSLEQFKREWLYRIGYPKVTARGSFDAEKQQYRLTFRQRWEGEGGPFHCPVEVALVDRRGRDMEGARKVHELLEEEGELVFDDLPGPPAFASLNRGCSFYGTFELEDASEETLALQARLDPDGFNRVDAMRRLTDRQRIPLLHDPGAPVGESWLELVGEILDGSRSSPALQAYLLRIEEQPMDRRYAVWYPELVAARDTLMKAVNRRCRQALVDRFHQLETYAPLDATRPGKGMEERLLKNTLLDLVAVDDTPASHELVVNHFRHATTATDRVGALVALNRSSCPERLAILEEVYKAWSSHLSGYANYLRVVAGGEGDDVFEMIRREKERETFDIKHPTWCRALFLPMAVNTRKVWTDEGIRWVADTVVELSSVNTTVASRLLNAFQHVQRLKSPLKEWTARALEDVLEAVSSRDNPTIHWQARSYLQGTGPAAG